MRRPLDFGLGGPAGVDSHSPQDLVAAPRSRGRSRRLNSDPETGEIDEVVANATDAKAESGAVTGVTNLRDLSSLRFWQKNSHNTTGVAGHLARGAAPPTRKTSS